MTPTHYPIGWPEGPWGVSSKGRTWYVCHRDGKKRPKCIGPARLKGRNYFDRAMEEAARRNTNTVANIFGAL